jgi:hypothetical protein
VSALAADPLSPAGALQVGAKDHEQDGSHSGNGGGALNLRRSVPLREWPIVSDDRYDGNGAVVENEEVVASGEPIERSGSSVGERISSPSSDEADDEDNGAGASFRRSTRIRRPNARFFDYVVELPESLGIQAMHAVMDPTSVKEALEAPDTNQWIKALNMEYS